jgi:hypothetical protein
MNLRTTPFLNFLFCVDAKEGFNSVFIYYY